MKTQQFAEDAHLTAVKLLGTATNHGTSIEELARSMLPRHFSEALLDNTRVRTDRRVQKLINIAGLCIALATHYVEQDLSERKREMRKNDLVSNDVEDK